MIALFPQVIYGQEGSDSVADGYFKCLVIAQGWGKSLYVQYYGVGM